MLHNLTQNILLVHRETRFDGVVAIPEVGQYIAVQARKLVGIDRGLRDQVQSADASLQFGEFYRMLFSDFVRALEKFRFFFV